MSFQTDLIEGELAEYEVLKLIHNKYPLAFKVEGNHKAYDLFVPEIDCGIEVKNDRQAHATGNIFFEVSFGGEPSGIITSRAMFWAYCTKEIIIWIKHTNIIRLILVSNPHIKTFLPHGEVKEVEGYLLKKESVVQLAEKVFERK